MPAPPTEAAELAWSRDDGGVWDYPTTGRWDKLRQRVTDFFHPFADETRAAAMDDGDDDGDDDAEPIEIPDASWAACFAAAAPIVFVCALVLLIGMVALFATSKRQDAPQSVPAPPPSVIPAAALPSAPPAPTTVTITPTPPPTVTVTATPQAAPPPAAEPAPTAASPPSAAAPNPDTVFRRLVLQIPGITVTNWEITQAGAHRVCGYLQAGHSHDDAIQQVLSNDPTFTRWQASAMVNASTAAYCPQYGG